MVNRILIKIGGRAFENEGGFRALAEAIKANKTAEVIIVHGGGAEISRSLKDAGRKTEFIDGIRITRAADIKIVEAVLSGTVNQRISAWLEANGVPCLRMSGKTEELFIVEPLTRNGRDLGFVGQIKQINPAAVERAIQSDKVPVISPISADENGDSFNVNADTAAAALAAAAGCTDLVFVTDVPGVLVDGRTQASLAVKEAQNLIADGIIEGGMVAKMESAFAALEKKVARVHIIQWQGPQTLASILERKSAAGTVIKS